MDIQFSIQKIPVPVLYFRTHDLPRNFRFFLLTLPDGLLLIQCIPGGVLSARGYFIIKVVFNGTWHNPLLGTWKLQSRTWVDDRQGSIEHALERWIRLARSLSTETFRLAGREGSGHYERSAGR